MSSKLDVHEEQRAHRNLKRQQEVHQQTRRDSTFNDENANTRRDRSIRSSTGKKEKGQTVAIPGKNVEGGKRQEVHQQTRRDSTFNDENANSRIDRSIRFGAGKKGKGQTVAIPGKNVEGGKRKRMFEEVTNQPREKSEVKRQRSPHIATETAPFTETKVNGTRRPQVAVKPQKPAEVENAKPSSKIPRLSQRSRSSMKIVVPIPKPKKSTGLTDLTSLEDAIHEVDTVISLPPDVIDIDLEDRNIFKCPDYAKDIIWYTKCMEARFRYPDNFKDKCPAKGKSRAVLIDWIIQVQQYLELSQQTLHLTVAMMDRFLISAVLPVQKIQLLGITCLFIATKYEERFTPSIAKLLHLTDNSYLHNEVIQMELKVLNVIQCELHMPTPIIFLERGMQVLRNQKDVEMMARYVLDLAVPFIETVHFSPSVKAAAAIYLANQILNAQAPRETTWMLSLSYFLACDEADILTCAIGFSRFLVGAETDKLQGAYTKHKHVSKLDILNDNPVLLELSHSDEITDF